MAVHEVAAVRAVPLPVRAGRLPFGASAGIGLAMVGLFVVLAIWGTVAPPHPPLATDPASQLLPPGPGHLLGTDKFGRDVLSRIMAGAGLDLMIAAVVTVIAFTIGALVGALSAYHGGWIDDVVLRVVDIVLAFPAFVLALAITAVLGNSVRNVVIAIAVAYTPYFIRLTRGEVLSARRADYADSARAVGNPAWRIVLLHLLPNSITPALVQASLTMGWSILDASGLSFLGLGVQVPLASWGNMLSGSQDMFRRAPWLVYPPGVMIFITVLCVVLLADGLRDAFDPRT